MSEETEKQINFLKDKKDVERKMKNIFTKFSKFIIKNMTRKNLTYRELGLLTGLNAGYINDVVHLKKKPSDKTIAKLVRVLEK